MVKNLIECTITSTFHELTPYVASGELLFWQSAASLF